MSKERARRREEREREAAVQAAARATEAERRERRAARTAALVSPLARWLPSRSTPRSPLAERKRRQGFAVLGVVLVVAGIAYAFTESLAALFLALAVGALAAPVLHTLLFRRT